MSAEKKAKDHEKASALKKAGGYRFEGILIPVVIIVIILQVLIITCIILVNNNSNKLNETMRNYSEYIDTATSLQAGTSILSETSSTFVLRPVLQDGNLNMSPLIAYAAELGNKRRGNDVIAMFEGYNVSHEAKQHIEVAAICSEKMSNAQIHAIALLKEVHELPNLSSLKALPEYELSEEELAMTAQQKEEKALDLVFGTEYSGYKAAVSQHVSACTGILKGESEARARDAMVRISFSRIMLWVVTIAIMIVIALAFFLLIKNLIYPLTRFVNKIATGMPLDDGIGLSEVRQVARSYNTLLDKHDALDRMLRQTAETDSLTGLQNRYSMQQYLRKTEGKGYSLAIILFDLNYLKITNDKKGHIEGDRLLCNAANCISECFGDVEENNCFRQGGDEFAAVLKGYTRAEIDEMIEKFYEDQEKFQVSIAAGYAYAEDVAQAVTDEMLEEADKNMYAKKQKMHLEQSPPF